MADVAAVPAPAAAEQPQEVRRIFTATLIIGPSGQGKTSLATTFSEYLWEMYRKVLLFYSCDGGAFPTRVQLRIRQGLIRPWRMRTRSAEGLAFETCHLASKGYWPRHINPETGETDPAVVLVPPVTARYDLFCQKGHHLKTVPSVSMITPIFCGQCKEMVTQAAMRVQETVAQTRGFEQVGGVFYDGLTSMCGWFMGELDVSRGHGLISGEKPPLGGPVLSGGVKFGGNNRADYGFAQTRAYQIVHNSLSIPNLYEGPVFTALPDDVTEGGGQLPIVGPKLAGSALTADALQWFGNALETRIEKSEQGHDVRRLYLSEFIDGQNRRHLLKNSGPGTLPKYIEDPPINPTSPDTRQFFTGFNLGAFFRLLDQALKDQLKVDDIPGAPGIAAAPTDYGDATTVEVGAAVPTPQAATPVLPLAAPPAVQPVNQGAGVVGSGPLAPHAQPVSPSPSGITAGAPSVTPRARSRRAPVQTPAVAAAQPQPAPTSLPLSPQPVPPTATAAPVVAPPAPSMAQPVAPVPAQPAAAQAVAPSVPPTGTVPPPPPSLRPPQKAPGS